MKRFASGEIGSYELFVFKWGFQGFSGQPHNECIDHLFFFGAVVDGGLHFDVLPVLVVIDGDGEFDFSHLSFVLCEDCRVIVFYILAWVLRKL